jgi:hypothetical protein
MAGDLFNIRQIDWNKVIQFRFERLQLFLSRGPFESVR